MKQFKQFLTILILSIGIFSNITFANRAEDEVFNFKRKDYNIKQIKSDLREYYFVYASVVDANLAIDEKNIVTDRASYSLPRCNRPIILSLLNEVDKCTPSHASYDETFKDQCHLYRDLIDEARFDFDFAEPTETTPALSLHKNDQLQNWKILPKSALSQDEITQLKKEISLLKRVSEDQVIYFKDFTISHDEQTKIVDLKYSLAEDSLLRRLIGVPGIKDKSPFQLLVGHHDNYFSTVDRVFACDLLNKRAILNLKAIIPVKVEDGVNSNQLWKLYVDYNKMKGIPLVNVANSSDMYAKSAIAGMRFQKVFGEVESRFSPAEYIALFNKVTNRTLLSITWNDFDFETTFKNLFPKKVVSDSIVVEIEASADL